MAGADLYPNRENADDPRTWGPPPDDAGPVGEAREVQESPLAEAHGEDPGGEAVRGAVTPPDQMGRLPTWLSVGGDKVGIGWLPICVGLSLLIGIAIGNRAVPQLESRLATVRRANAELRTAAGEMQDEVSALEDEVSALEDRNTDLQSQVDDLEDKVLPANEIRDRESALDARDERLDDREAELRALERELDSRESDLDDRQAAISGQEHIMENATFGDGTYVIGEDIPAGTYVSPGGSNCYWARLSGLGGSLDEIITNHLGSGPQTVAIPSSDVAFETTGCGEWSPR
jgi:flagellar biosynthesis chaperone FliJ